MICTVSTSTREQSRQYYSSKGVFKCKCFGIPIGIQLLKYSVATQLYIYLFVFQIFGRSAKTANANRPKGLYLFGSVGCGKTMLMDLFHETSFVKKSKRVHFHSFMLGVHKSKCFKFYEKYMRRYIKISFNTSNTTSFSHVSQC